MDADLEARVNAMIAEDNGLITALAQRGRELAAACATKDVRIKALEAELEALKNPPASA